MRFFFVRMRKTDGTHRNRKGNDLKLRKLKFIDFHENFYSQHIQMGTRTKFLSLVSVISQSKNRLSSLILWASVTAEKLPMAFSIKFLFKIATKMRIFRKVFAFAFSC